MINRIATLVWIIFYEVSALLLGENYSVKAGKMVRGLLGRFGVEVEFHEVPEGMPTGIEVLRIIE